MGNAIRIGAIAIALSLVWAASGAAASPLTVTSYSMTNGGTGSFDYRDFTYVPCNGVCDVTSSSLSGGTGKLTDGVSPALSWYQYGWYTPWVGWCTCYQGETDPTVTFNFGGVKNINSVTVWVDNTIGSGGVGLPSGVFIDGIFHAIAPDNSNPAPRGYTFSGLGLTGSSVTVQFAQVDPWVMVGEVSFDGTGVGVPEPAVWVMLITGLGGIGATLRRRRALAVITVA